MCVKHACRLAHRSLRSAAKPCMRDRQRPRGGMRDANTTHQSKSRALRSRRLPRRQLTWVGQPRPIQGRRLTSSPPRSGRLLGQSCLVQGVWRRHLPRSRQPHPFQGGRTSRRSSRTMRTRSEEWRRTSRRMSGCLTSSPPRSRHLIGQHSLLQGVYDRRRHLPRCLLQGAHA